MCAEPKPQVGQCCRIRNSQKKWTGQGNRSHAGNHCNTQSGRRWHQVPRVKWPSMAQNATRPSRGVTQTHRSQPSPVSATPATQIDLWWHRAPCLPHKVTIDGTRCHARRHTDQGATRANLCQSSAVTATPPSATHATRSDHRWQQMPRLSYHAWHAKNRRHTDQGAPPEPAQSHKCHCQTKWPLTAPSAMPATQRYHQWHQIHACQRGHTDQACHQSQPSAVSAACQTKWPPSMAPSAHACQRKWHKVTIDGTECHACHTTRAAVTQTSAHHQSQPHKVTVDGSKCHACHTMGPSMAPNAKSRDVTCATRANPVPSVPRLPHKRIADGTKRPATQSDHRWHQMPRLPRKRHVDVTKVVSERVLCDKVLYVRVVCFGKVVCERVVWQNGWCGGGGGGSGTDAGRGAQGKNKVRAPLRGRVFQHMDIFLFNYVPKFRHDESGFSQISIFCGCVKSHGRVWKNESHGVILMVFVGRKPSAWKRQLYSFSSALPTSLFQPLLHQRLLNVASKYDQRNINVASTSHHLARKIHERYCTPPTPPNPTPPQPNSSINISST